MEYWTGIRKKVTQNRVGWATRWLTEREDEHTGRDQDRASTETLQNRVDHDRGRVLRPPEMGTSGAAT